MYLAASGVSCGTWDPEVHIFSSCGMWAPEGEG